MGSSDIKRPNRHPIIWCDLSKKRSSAGPASMWLRKPMMRKFVEILEIKRFGVFSYTELRGQQNSYVVNCPRDTLVRYFLPPSRTVQSGRSHRTRLPRHGRSCLRRQIQLPLPQAGRAATCSSSTRRNIATREMVESRMQGPSQFYIKPLGRLPGDTLQIRPPELFINGERAKGKAFDRVMSAENRILRILQESNREYPTWAGASFSHEAARRARRDIDHPSAKLFRARGQ